MHRRVSKLVVVAVVCAAAVASRSARAEPPAPYSLPWQLRPAAAGNAVRSDTTFARYEDTSSRGGLTVASTLLASFKVPGTGQGWTGLAPLVRFAVVNDAPPTGPGGFAFINPLVGATYALSLGGGLRLAPFLGFTIPAGMGGGDSPDAGAADARTKGVLARSAMDNALFAVDDFTVIPGIGAAWVDHGLTIQLEATLLQLTRVRGSIAQHEASKTNFTSGLHVGYFVAPVVSLGAELRYQRWIDAPFSVDTSPDTVDNLTFAVGPRFHFDLGGTVAIHPGIAYARGLDEPMAAAAPNYHIVQLDVPVTF